MSGTLPAGNLGRNGSLFGRPGAPSFIKNPGPSIHSTRSLMALKFPISPKVPIRSNKFNHLGGYGFFAVSGGFRPRIAPMTGKRESQRRWIKKEPHAREAYAWIVVEKPLTSPTTTDRGRPYGTPKPAEILAFRPSDRVRAPVSVSNRLGADAPPPGPASERAALRQDRVARVGN